MQYGKQPQAEAGTIESEEPPQKSPQERAAEFEKLIKGDYGTVHVLLAYYDKINGLEVEAAAMDDL